MTFYAVAARFLLLTAIGFTCNPHQSLIVATEDATWRPDLPWGNLKSKISPSASLIDTTFMNYQKECIPEFVDYLWPDRTNHALIDQPHGLCLPHMYCGWQMCNPNPSDNGHLNETLSQVLQDQFPINQADKIGGELPASFDPSNTDSDVQDPSNPSLNLPAMVLFPVVASDVVAAIQFAKEHGLEISVKNSGHSYTGASSKKNTLHVNMNRYTQYATTSITDCDASIMGNAIAGRDLSDQPCHLSFAKKKSATIRVGGGENWDKAYRAVLAANQIGEEYKYHVLGGAAGTVSPMGWTFLGGLGGTTAGRLYGLGVDQVLQIEMVLPNGYHVKFGPTEWEDASAEGFIVPRTTGVSGLCRRNPEEQVEGKWKWGSCPDHVGINFGDLWFAVRGGGGGTWGVVTSIYLQLHDYLPFALYKFVDSEECSAVPNLHDEFKATYMIAPSLLNVTKEKSEACSAANGTGMHCFGEEDVMKAWTKFLQINNMMSLQDASCLVKDTTHKSFPETILESDARVENEGKAEDNPYPALVLTSGGQVLAPQSWAKENIKTIASNEPYFAFGGATATGSDQYNSLSQAHRNAAVMLSVGGALGVITAGFFSTDLFPQMFDISDKTKFPPVIGSNHAAAVNMGPRKKNWIESCPLTWTFEERNAKCISLQESIYGTERLKQLESIKEAVDPHYMFDCASCIGNNRLKKKAKKVKKGKKGKSPKEAKKGKSPKEAKKTSKGSKANEF
eukprot:CAMPEP_0198248814 /NCGR_PEP_ID=MMETSP1447-20131203/491_1 /TAXON_ID=420782 /ORGANISM="Chaetoceros dichaeta, Strain CCMP1751" /LENGTH=733 /DNA_ID=CAMNT_0043933295 /DNA_START=60 /DNA_END=2261 /DNA_ORIENTATION=+